MSEEKTYPNCWKFDINRRTYKQDSNGRSVGGPIWIKHWIKQDIVDETPRSWITTGGRKIPKKAPALHERIYAFSWEEVMEKAWVHDHAYHITELVRFEKDASVLKQIAELVGYDEREKE